MSWTHWIPLTSTCYRFSLKKLQSASKHIQIDVQIDGARTLKANNSWPLVLSDLQWFIDHGKGKKMYFDEVEEGRILFSTFSDDVYRTAGPLSPPRMYSQIALMQWRMSKMRRFVLLALT